MANVRVQNRTTFLLAVPRPLNLRLKQGQVKEVEVIDVDRTFNDPRIKELVDKKWLKLTMVQDDTPDSGATLPFYTTAALPDPAANSGMMVYNTTTQIVLYSDGSAWLATSALPGYTNAPAPGSLPAGYLIWEKDSQSILYNGGSAWMRTTANGVTSRPSHQFPAANTVPRGTLMFDTDNEQLKLSDGTSWQMTNNVLEYSTIANLPTVTDVGFGALAYTSRDGTIWIRVGGNWQTTTGLVRFYADFASLPTNATWGNDERGAIAYINDDRTFVVWEGKYWRYLMQPQHFPNASLPSASGYGTGHMIYDETYEQHLCQAGGLWEGIQGAARSYSAALRPPNASVPEGTTIWNTTSNKANFNIGGSWVDALGVVDP